MSDVDLSTTDEEFVALISELSMHLLLLVQLKDACRIGVRWISLARLIFVIHISDQRLNLTCSL